MEDWKNYKNQVICEISNSFGRDINICKNLSPFDPNNIYDFFFTEPWLIKIE